MSLINALKSEIARVARKELKEELLSLRKAATLHRSEIAALKRQVKALTSSVKGLLIATRAQKPAAVPAEETLSRFRFSAERFKAWRQKMNITQAETALLLGSSAVSVFKWEDDTHPRNAQLTRIAEVMKLGKRELMRRLQDVKAAQEA